MRTARHLQVVASEGKTLENNCHYRSADLHRVSDAGLNEIQTLFLQLFRHLCESLSSGAEIGNSTAYELAERSLGARNGLVLLGHTADLVNAIQTERCGNFAFMPTGCPVCSSFLSEEECITMDLLRTAQCGDDIALANQARFMTAGGPAQNTTIAALALARLFDRLANEPMQSHERSGQSL